MAYAGTPRPILTFYGADCGKPSLGQHDKISHSTRLENAVIAAFSRITRGHYSSAVICDGFGTPIVWLNTSSDSMSIKAIWLEE